MAARIALTFSALLALAAVALAGPYGDLQHSLESAKSPQDRAQILQKSPLAQQVRNVLAAQKTVSSDSEDDSAEGQSRQEMIEEAIAIRAQAEDAGAPGSNVKAIASEIKRNPVYTDRGEREQTNWLYRAIQRLRNLRFNMPKAKGPDVPQGLFGPWIIYVAWIALGSALLLFLYFGLKRVNFAALRGSKKGAGLLGDDDPDRTLDEWLVLADQLESEGRYREAVRSLYLACLLKIDEARIARFDRGQTNWEHLARIESSPRRPAELDFRHPTQAFDRIWYGYQVLGAEDVARFRQWYRDIVDATRRAAA